MSEEFIEKAGLIWIEEPPLYGFKRGEHAPWFLPPLNFTDPEFPYLADESHFAGIATPPRFTPHPAKHCMLDYQFVYNPQDFLNMSGGKWAVFRKNVRKFPKRHRGWLLYRVISTQTEIDLIPELVFKWCERHPHWDDEKNGLFDSATLSKFIIHGENKMGLFLNDRLVGLNVWDENYRYVNFRVCIDDGTPFLNEYLRYKFYTCLTISSRNKWVNDGGAVDSENIYRFKMKLNPAIVYKVYSYVKEGYINKGESNDSEKRAAAQ